MNKVFENKYFSLKYQTLSGEAQLCLGKVKAIRQNFTPGTTNTVKSKDLRWILFYIFFKDIIEILDKYGDLYIINAKKNVDHIYS